MKIEAESYRGLRAFSMEVDGVCALVGENGAGKSSALGIPAVLGGFQCDNPAGAFEQNGGLWGIVNVEGGATQARLSVSVESIRGELIYAPGRVEERLWNSDSDLSFARVSPDTKIRRMDEPATNRYMELMDSGRPLPRAIASKDAEWAAAATRYADVIESYRVYARYKLDPLRSTGSPQSNSVALSRRGENVFALLRNWRDKASLEERFQWVSSALRESFGREFSKFDFESAASIVGAQFLRPSGSAVASSGVSDGLLTMLLHLCAIASAPDHGVVAIDEPENSLSPFAIRKLVEFARDRAKQRGVSVLFATHSPALLNHFREDPAQVWIFDSSDDSRVKRLTEWKDEDWLSLFSLGDLYAREVVAAPRAESAA